MRAVVCREFGPPEAHRVEEVPPPPLTPGTIRVKVQACALSFANLLVIEGKHQNTPPLPFTPGTEIAGTVMEIYLPSTLGYGAVGSSDPVVPPDSVLIYTVQLLGLNGPGQEPLSLAGAPIGGCPPLPKKESGGSNGLYALFALVIIGGGGYWYWKKQQDAAAAAGGPMPPAAGGAAPAALPDGWEEMTDTASGRVYYYNSKTGASAWEKPSA